MCMCVCVRERERKKESARKRQRQTERGREREKQKQRAGILTYYLKRFFFFSHLNYRIQKFSNNISHAFITPFIFTINRRNSEVFGTIGKCEEVPG